MTSPTPIGVPGYTSGAIRPKTKIASNGVVTTDIGGLNINPTGQFVSSAVPVRPPTPRPRDPYDIQKDNGKGPSQIVKNAKWAPSLTTPKKPAWQDSDYQSQMNAIKRALDLYNSNMGIQRTRAGSQYATSSRDMGQQKTRDLKDMQDDFAARGIVSSGVYGTSVGDYNKEWGQQKDALSKQYKNALSDITTNYTSYVNDVQTQKEQARLDAIRRRAQKLELNPPKKKK